MQSVFAAMGRCPLFEGIPEEKYPNVLTCLRRSIQIAVS